MNLLPMPAVVAVEKTDSLSKLRYRLMPPIKVTGLKDLDYLENFLASV